MNPRHFPTRIERFVKSITYTVDTRTQATYSAFANLLMSPIYELTTFVYVEEVGHFVYSKMNI